MKKKTTLTQQQKRFVANYIKSLDATKSAVEAGYKTETAKQKAQELLKNPQIIAQIHYQIESESNSLNINNAYIVKKLLQIINSTSQEEALMDKTGVPTGQTKLKDAAVALRAVDILAKFTSPQKAEYSSISDNSGIKIMCIENLDDSKI